jgi:hypothetical protein
MYIIITISKMEFSNESRPTAAHQEEEALYKYLVPPQDAGRLSK